MSIPTAELTIGEITKLQEIFLEAKTPLSLPQFIDAFQHGLRRRVDHQLMALLFALIDADDTGEISWVEFQAHIQLIRRDAQSQKEKAIAFRHLFEEHRKDQEKQIKEFYHTAPIMKVFQPNDDSFITASRDGTVKRWDADQFRHLDTIHYNTNGANDACFQESSGLLVVANSDQTVSLYDVRQPTAKLLRTFLTCRASIGDEVEVFRQQFRYPKPTPQFTFQGVPAPELEGSVMKKYWETEHSNLLQRVWAYSKFVERYTATSMPQTTSDVTSVHVLGDDTKASLYLGLNDGSLHIYHPRINLRSDDDVAQAINPVHMWRPHQAAITQIYTEPAEELMITCSADNNIHMIHLERGMILKTLKPVVESNALTDRCHTRGVKGFAVSKVPKLLGSWGLERYAILWDPLVGKPTQILDGHLAKLIDVKFTPTDENLVFTYSEDNVTKVWDMRTFRCLQQLRDHPWSVAGRPGCLFYDETRKALITATHRLYWKHPTNRRDEESAAHSLPILNLSYCDEQQLLVSCDESSVRLWDTRSNSLISKWPVDNVHGVCVDHGGIAILIETGPEELKVYSSSSGQPSLVLTGTSKPPYLAELDHRYIFWDLGYWIVTTPKQLLLYEAGSGDQKVLMYPMPVFKKELWALTSRIVSMCMCGGRLVIALQGGEVLFILLGTNQPMDPKHQPFIRIESLPPSFNALEPLRSYLHGPLHHSVRRIIVDANKVRNARLNIKDATAILDEVPDDNAKDDRVDCLAAITSDVAVAARNFGCISLWDMNQRKEVFRFHATVQKSSNITALEATRDGKLLFVADDSGYIGVFDVALLHQSEDAQQIPLCETAAHCSWYAKRILRRQLFRADVGVISSIAFSQTKNILYVSSTTGCLLVVTPAGERLSAMGVGYAPRPPVDTLHFEVLQRQYRQEMLMQRSDSGAFTAAEMADYVCAQYPSLFPQRDIVITLLQEMAPDSADMELERLMEKTNSGVYIPLHAKPLTDAQREQSKKRDAPLTCAQDVQGVPMVALWRGAQQAFRISKQTKPFTRKITGHAKLLEDLEDLRRSQQLRRRTNHGDEEIGPHPTTTDTRSNMTVVQTNAPRHAAHAAAVADDDTDEADLVRLERDQRELLRVDERDERGARMDASFTAMHSTYAVELFNDTSLELARVHHALCCFPPLFAECYSAEYLLRSRIVVAEQRTLEHIGAQMVESAARILSETESTTMVSHSLCDDEDATVIHASSPVREKQVPAAGRPLRRATTPVGTPRTGNSESGIRRTSSCNDLHRVSHASWRNWKEPSLLLTFGSKTWWSETWATVQDEIAFGSEDSFKRKELRVQGVLHRFRVRCIAVVEQIIHEWREDRARAQRFRWTTSDGIHVHCVTNPISARVAGSMIYAAKTATREMTAQEAFTRAQQHASIRIHTPISCLVRMFGLVFYCSGVLPCLRSDEVHWDDKAPLLVDMATAQVFQELHLEIPDTHAPTSIPHGLKRYLSKDNGRSWVVNLRAIFPSFGPQAGDAATASRRMRPEAVANASCAISSRCFSTDVPLADRRRADRDGIKLLRNLETAMVAALAQSLLDEAVRGVMAYDGQLLGARFHKAGLGLCSLAVVTFTTLRLCSAMGVVKRGGVRLSHKSTAGVLRDDTVPSSEAEDVIDFDTTQAPQRLLRFLNAELVARSFRHVVEEEMRKAFFAHADHKRDSRSTANRAVDAATHHTEMLLQAGNTLPSINYWNNRLIPASVRLFPHGEYADRISYDECDVDLIARRIESLCGFQLDDHYQIRQCVSQAKTMQYANPYDDASLVVPYGSEFHAPFVDQVKIALGQYVGPERWWLERHLLRLAVLQRRPQEVPETYLTMHPTKNNALDGEYCQLIAVLEASRGIFESACKRVRRLCTSDVFNHSLVKQQVVGTLLDLYQWTGQLGLLMDWAEKQLKYIRDARTNHNEASGLDESCAVRTLASSYLAIPANVHLHRAARELLLRRFEDLRMLLPIQPLHESIISSLQDLSKCHVDMEEEYEGIEILRRLLRLTEVRFGPNHKMCCSMMESIGEAYAQVGDYDASVKQYNNSMERRSKGYPDDPGERAVPHVMVAEVLLKKGDLAAATTAMRGAHLLVGSLPYDHPVLLKKLELEANLAERCNDLNGALAAWTKILDARERTRGSLSTSAADALVSLGRLMFDLERYHESWHCFDVCLGIRVKLLGRMHPAVASTLAWLARSEAAAGSPMDAVEVFQMTLELFDEMCRGDNTASTFPKLKAQALVDMATLLLKDVEIAHSKGTPLQVKRLMVVGRNHQAELLRAVQYLDQAEALMMPIVQDLHHASIRAIRALRDACTQLSAVVTHDEETLTEASERIKRIDQWAHANSASDRHSSTKRITSDAMWYRKSHKIYKLKM